jgi:hypothetical protein
MNYSRKSFFKTISPHWFSALLALAIATAFSACGTASKGVTQDNLDKILPNMSSADVKSILGEPTETQTDPIPIVGGTKTTYTYRDNDNSIVIILKNDTVQTKEGHFGGAQ